jgi:hypothetical protein
MNGGRGLLVVLAGAALLASACEKSEPAASRARPSPADVVPRDASVYAEATLRFTGKDGRAARRFGSAVTGQAIPEDALLTIVADAIDAELDFDLLRPWFGSRAGFFLTDLPGEPAAAAVVLESRDARAAARYLRKDAGNGVRAASYQGVRFWRKPDGRAAGLVDGNVVLATSQEAVRATIAARKAPLASTKRYRSERGKGTPFAFLMASAPALRAGLGGVIPWTRSERRYVCRFLAPEGDLVIRASVTERQLVAQIDGLRRQAKPPEPIASFPGDSWLAGSSGDLSAALTNPLGRQLGSSASLGRTLQQVARIRLPKDLMRGLRRGTFYIQGHTFEPTGQLLAEVADRRAALRAITRFGRALKRRGTHHVDLEIFGRQEAKIYATPRRGSAAGTFDLGLMNGDLAFEFGAVGGGSELGDKPVYRQAKDALGTPPTILLDVQGLLKLEDPTGTRDVGAVGRLAYVAAAERSRGDSLSYSFVVRLAPGRIPTPTPDDGPDGQS